MNFINQPLFIIALLVVSALAGFFWGWPQYQQFEFATQDAERRGIDLRNREQYLAQLSHLRERLSEHEGKLAQIHEALPDELSLPLLYSRMQALAAESGGTFQSATTTEAEKAQGTAGTTLRAVSVSFSFTGSYEDLKIFVNNIHASSRFLEIDSIQFASDSRQTAETTGEQFNFQITAKAYSY
ncbi:MAG: type 4a pilus biogenesis protein PilO [Candidatus Yanofskybacteria bacterium]|nr:type 4a pilus biogenesis protein PilO [Candidatus Yanofskybacteria bacterium]